MNMEDNIVGVNAIDCVKWIAIWIFHAVFAFAVLKL